MTSFNVLSNDFIFPLFLLALFIYVIVFFPQTQTQIKTQTQMQTQMQTIEVEADKEMTKDGDRLEDFYELVVQDQSLQSELDMISSRDLLVDFLVGISKSHGYGFTALDINNSIKEYTEVSQDDYVCLPIGCWRVSG